MARSPTARLSVYVAWTYTTEQEILGIVKVAVISGGNWPQFEKQVLSALPHDERLKNLSILPTCGTKL